MNHEVEISVFGIDMSQKEPYQEKIGDKEGFQSSKGAKIKPTFRHRINDNL